MKFRSTRIDAIVLAPMILLMALPVRAEPPNYEDHIKPLFRAHCLMCHNVDEASADLDLSSMAAVLKGGSSGSVVNAGRPESSQLYRAMAHLDGAEAMPPESPKLSDEKLALVQDWIRGGLIAGKGGKSQLRSVTTMLAPPSSSRPAPMPESLPKTKISSTNRPPLPQALAVSPGASLFAVSGHEQVLLFSGQSQSPQDNAVVVDNGLKHHWTWDGDDGSTAGKIGSAGHFGAEAAIQKIEPTVDFSQFSELTLATWIRPQDGPNNPTIFGAEAGFRIFFERQKDGWRPRIFLRDQDNGIHYFGRVGALPVDRWSHLAAVWTGTKWIWYIDGRLIAEQECAETLKRIQQRPDAIQAIGGMLSRADEKLDGFSGDLDDLRIYAKALTREEISQVMLEASQTKAYGLLGALPFPEGTIHDIKFSRSGSLLIVAGGRGAYSGSAVLFDVKTGERVAKIGDEVDSVLAADVSADHRFVALGGPAKTAKVFSTKTGELVHRIERHTDWITAVAFSPDGAMFATGDRSGGIHVWETEKGAIAFTLDEHKVRITNLNWRADGSIVASGAEDGNLILWSMKDGFPVRNIVAHTSKESPRYSRRTGVLSLEYANNGRLFTTGRDGKARLWSGEGVQQLEFPIERGLPLSAGLLDDATAAVIGSFDGTLHVFDLASKSRTQLLNTDPAAGANDEANAVFDGKEN